MTQIDADENENSGKMRIQGKLGMLVNTELRT